MLNPGMLTGMFDWYVVKAASIKGVFLQDGGTDCLGMRCVAMGKRCLEDYIVVVTAASHSFSVLYMLMSC